MQFSTPPGSSPDRVSEDLTKGTADSVEQIADFYRRKLATLVIQEDAAVLEAVGRSAQEQLALLSGVGDRTPQRESLQDEISATFPNDPDLAALFASRVFDTAQSPPSIFAELKNLYARICDLAQLQGATPRSPDAFEKANVASAPAPQWHKLPSPVSPQLQSPRLLAARPESSGQTLHEILFPTEPITDRQADSPSNKRRRTLCIDAPRAPIANMNSVIDHAQPGWEPSMCPPATDRRSPSKEFNTGSESSQHVPAGALMAKKTPTGSLPRRPPTKLLPGKPSKRTGNPLLPNRVASINIPTSRSTGSM